MDSFTTDRLLAERLTAEHLPHLRLMDRNEPFMAKLGGVRDEAGTIRYLEANLAHWAEYGFGLWMLRERESGTLIGRAVLRHLDIEGTDEVETGYGFLPPYWGRGLATEAARACVQIGRNRLGLRSIIAITLPSNTASQRVLVKAGLAYEREVIHSGLPHALYRSVS